MIKKCGKLLFASLSAFFVGLFSANAAELNLEELANRVSNILTMAKRDIDPNKTGAKNLIDSMYNKGELTSEEKQAVINMIGG